MNILVRAHGGLGDELCMTPTYRVLSTLGNVYVESKFLDIIANSPYASIWCGEVPDRTIDMLWHNESGYGYDMHLIDYFAHQSGVYPTSRKLDLYPQMEHFEFARTILDTLERPIVMYCEYKGWEMKGVLSNEMILAISKLPITLIRIGDAPKWNGIGYNLVGYTGNILNTAALLSMCDLYIGNDSGLAHIAGAMSTRSIILYGSTDYKYYVHGGQIPLYSDECSGCYNRGERTVVKGICTRGDYVCTRMNTPKVLGRVEEVLSEG
jgi:hypothetical protein